MAWGRLYFGQPYWGQSTAFAEVILVYTFINAKAFLIRLKSKPGLSARARILPSQAFQDEMAATIRELGGKLEIQWDGSNWIDETEYLVSARANEELAKTSGEGIAATLDVELDNTTERFTPDNEDSPIYTYLKPRVNIRISIVAAEYTYRLFTGYIKNLHPNTRNRICSIECFDNQVLVYNQKSNGVVYPDYRSDQLLEVLVNLVGLNSSQYVLDVGSHVINYGYFDDRNVWPLMGEIAVAERGRVFFDRDGILKFWNRDRLHNQSAIATLTLEDDIIDLDYSVAEHEIKNIVTVKAQPRAGTGTKQVWSNGDAQYLDPYSDTLIYVPAQSSQVAFIELEDPLITVEPPVTELDYTANSQQDGEGTDLTGYIQIHEFINYGNAIFVNVINLSGTDAYLTKFSIRGNPAVIQNWIRIRATDQPSIDLYGKQELEIENNFIEDEAAATDIALEELQRRKDSKNLFRISIVGTPYLLCGDIVNVEYRPGQFKEYMIDQLDWVLDDGGFKQGLTLVNPYTFPEIKFVSARGYIIKEAHTREVSAKANITGPIYAKNISAGAYITGGFGSKLIEARGNISPS